MLNPWSPSWCPTPSAAYSAAGTCASPQAGSLRPPCPTRSIPCLSALLACSRNRTVSLPHRTHMATLSASTGTASSSMTPNTLTTSSGESVMSSNRRKAPIYWLLQSSKKNYALWIYYHRLDKDILFKALLNYVEPKIRREESRLEEVLSQKTALGPAAKGAKKLDKDIDRQDAFLSELRDFEDKLRRAANLHLDPDLNDGVVLNIAPLRELVPWKEAKSY